MKKVISMVLCVVMLFSVVSVCAGAADTKASWNALSVKATEVSNGKVTYNIYLEPNVSVVGTIIHIEYDKAVLQPILSGTYTYTDDETGKVHKLSSIADGGAFMTTDKYGDKTYSVPGTYAGGKVYNKNNVLSVAYTDLASFRSTSRKGFFSIPFKVIDSKRPVTGVKFYCVEFKGENENLNIDKNSDNPYLFKTVSTDTFEKTVITGATSVANGMQITWKATAGADFYRFYKAKDGGGWTTVEKNLSTGTTSYIDKTARHGVKEKYAVRAFKKDGRSAATYNTITGLFVLPVSKVSAANSGDGVKISWSSVKGADGYRVYKRVTNANGTKTEWMTIVTNTTAKSYIDRNVANNVKYEYIVRAHMDKSWSANSAACSIYHYDAPTVKAASVSGGVKITWNAISGAETYRIYRKYSGESSWTNLKVVSSGTRSYTDTKATSGKTVDYTVRAYSSKGNSNYVAKKINYIATPKLTSIANGTGGLVVKWGAVKGASSYKVYRKASGENSWTLLGTVKTATYTDKTAKSGKVYSYTVKALNGNAISGYDTKGISLERLAMPTLTKISNSSTGITVKWNAVAGATGYKVYRKAAGASGWSNLGSVKTTSFTDKNAVNGKTYTYTVRATDGSNVSAYNSAGLSIKRTK